MRTGLFLAGIVSLALLAGCNNLSSPGSGTSSSTINLSVAIKSPAKDAFTNSLMVQVNATATGPGARVDRAEVAYTGPQNGTLPLTPRGGVWEGTLPSTLPSGVYTLTPKAWVGSVEKSGDSVRFTLDRDPPSVSFVSVPTPLGQETVEVRVSVTDALSGVAEVRLFAGAKDLGAFTPLGNGVYTFSLRPEDLPQGDVNLRVVARDRAGNEASASQNLNVDRTAPTVVWRRPADGSQVSG
ncbi:Ig-like domain-containing protein, partial [Thermus altitudinis]|uniref:Ig-like domain-containing protein n=1 Tax=Thermus altitudinis TaxID=2908145 RepID=UPI00311A9E5C